jgi:hypothetical protein
MLTFLMHLDVLIVWPKSDTFACCRYMPIGGGGGGGGGGGRGKVCEQGLQKKRQPDNGNTPS